MQLRITQVPGGLLLPDCGAGLGPFRTGTRLARSTVRIRVQQRERHLLLFPALDGADEQRIGAPRVQLRPPRISARQVYHAATITAPRTVTL